MENMKKEILELIKRFETNNYKYIPMNNDGIEYFVILNNGISFYIAQGSNKIPDFCESDIVYIRKKFTCTDIKSTEMFYDTINGIIYLDDQITHANKIMQFFGVDSSGDFNTGCYD